MSLQDIRDGLYFTLVTWGPYASTEVSTCAFDVLESTSACAIVFTPGGDTIFEPLTMGASATDIRLWSIGGAVYVKDTGDPKLFFRRVWQAHDDLYDTLRKDRSFNNTAQFGRLTRLSFNPDLGVEAAGAYWGRIEFSITAEEYDGG